MSLAVIFGSLSVAFWFCCPLWMLVWLFPLPLGLAGIWRGVIEYRATKRQGDSPTQPLIGLLLSCVGTAAAVAYLLFVLSHPDLLSQS